MIPHGDQRDERDETRRFRGSVLCLSVGSEGLACLVDNRFLRLTARLWLED